MLKKIRMKMKNRTDDAVSVVIGVTLMVAVTIAMAAVAYAYFTGLIGGGQEVDVMVSMIQQGSFISITGVENGPVANASIIVQLLNKAAVCQIVAVLEQYMLLV